MPGFTVEFRKFIRKVIWEAADIFEEVEDWGVVSIESAKNILEDFLKAAAGVAQESAGERAEFRPSPKVEGDTSRCSYLIAVLNSAITEFSENLSNGLVHRWAKAVSLPTLEGDIDKAVETALEFQLEADKNYVDVDSITMIPAGEQKELTVQVKFEPLRCLIKAGSPRNSVQTGNSMHIDASGALFGKDAQKPLFTYNYHFAKHEKASTNYRFLAESVEVTNEDLFSS